MQHIGPKQLRHQADDIVLRGHIITQQLAGFFPDLLQRELAIHLANNQIGFGRKTVELSGRMILQDIPGLAAIDVAMNRRVTTQAGTQIFNQIPRCAKQR